MKRIICLSVFCTVFFLGCSISEDIVQEDNPISNSDDPVTNDGDNNTSTGASKNLKILALGDSYTIGESVCTTCRFPEQLKDSLALKKEGYTFALDIIAKTGWTTTSLINAINDESPSKEYDLVTLLIGVNNQYQGKPFSLYSNEFPQLLNKAIDLAKGDKNNVIVISIPDYAYTPFGQGSSDPSKISSELNDYNDFAENYSNQRGITFVYITDITRQGLNNPDLVASDGLHPSTLAYTKFVERLRPIAMVKLE